MDGPAVRAGTAGEVLRSRSKETCGQKKCHAFFRLETGAGTDALSQEIVKDSGNLEAALFEALCHVVDSVLFQ